jgi:hypothetical protein
VAESCPLRQRVATLLQVGDAALVNHRVASVLDQLLGRVAGGRRVDDEGNQLAQAGDRGVHDVDGSDRGVP